MMRAAIEGLAGMAGQRVFSKMVGAARVQASTRVDRRKVRDNKLNLGENGGEDRKEKEVEGDCQVK